MSRFLGRLAGARAAAVTWTSRRPPALPPYHRAYCGNRPGDGEDYDEGGGDTADAQVKDFIDRQLRLSSVGHQVLVIQPYVKWGANKDRQTSPELKAEESESLVRTLSGWSVVDTMRVGLTSYRKRTFFGPGNVDAIADRVGRDRRVTAVFVSVNVLKPAQHQHLEHRFRVPVFDRYLMVVQIFRRHAVSREAKLQVRLAEVPYMWSRMRGAQPGYADRLLGGDGTGVEEAAQIAATAAGAGHMSLDDKRDLLKEYEKKLRRAVDKVRGHREHLRRARRAKELPVVAVVGYTNAGKTSLVRALTGDASLAPRDCLFATLDVTVHGGPLPCGLRALYVDTVGFMSDLPTRLIEPFVATLEDAVFADVIVHVTDASHPNAAVQKRHVETTLRDLSAELMDRVIDVGNKADRLAEPGAAAAASAGDFEVMVSCARGTGLDELRHAIEQRVMAATGRRLVNIRVRTGREEYEWLRAHTVVVGVDADGEHSVVRAVVTQSDLDVFKSLFIVRRNKTD